MMDTTSTSGTLEDFASFFGKTLRWAQKQKAAGKIAYWQSGRNIMIGEESVLDFYVKGFHVATGMRLTRDEIRARGRREWREHLGIRRSVSQQFEILQSRFDELEKRLDHQTAVAAGIIQPHPLFGKEQAA